VSVNLGEGGVSEQGGDGGQKWSAIRLELKKPHKSSRQEQRCDIYTQGLIKDVKYQFKDWTGEFSQNREP
jgi:hypothetical protein